MAPELGCPRSVKFQQGTAAGESIGDRRRQVELLRSAQEELATGRPSWIYRLPSAFDTHGSKILVALLSP